MTNTIKVLDHGYVKLRNLSGPVRRSSKSFDASDIDPAITARISFDNLDAERTREQDLNLVNYLMRNHHSTPIEMIEVWLEMKMPLFVARQFVRHRTATINEVSGRYAILPEEWYIPEIVRGKAKSNKQGSEDNLPTPIQEEFKKALNDNCSVSYDSYLMAIKHGVAPEQARMFLHVNHYTYWVWKQDLHNLMHFMGLRLHEHAQWEARVYAQAVYNLLKQFLPETMKLFDKYRRF